jgi:AmmeMemoRadiSam system protein B
MDLVAAHCEKLAGQAPEAPGPWVAAICPHDDYVYAGPVYVGALRGLRAKTVVLFGVCHKARALGLRDKLVFDSFERWRGPHGPVPVSPLREALQRRLPPGDWVVSDEAQGAEWSVEGIVPWLQYYNRDVAIVPILVPQMGWPRTAALAEDLARALAEAVKEEGLVLGDDLAFVMSCDASHYGDQPEGWDYAPFGCGPEGYLKGQAQDEILVREYLTGPMEMGKARGLAGALVDQEDLTKYKVTWCGRFSVPLGLATLRLLADALGRRPLEGASTGYATSVGTGLLPFEKAGLGATAPANLHHWVGYVAVVYR